jgi:hypothetical protein
MLDYFLPWSLMTLANIRVLFPIRPNGAPARFHSPRPTPSIHTAIPSTDLSPPVDRTIFAPGTFFNFLRFIIADSSLDIQG